MYQKKSEKQLANEKSERIMQGIAYWAAFFRLNPHRFAKDYYRYARNEMEKLNV